MDLVLSSLARVHHAVDDRCQDEKTGRNQQQLRQTKYRNEPAGDLRAQHGPQRCAYRNDGKKALTPFLGIEIVREGPELRYDHQIEYAHPQKEDHRDWQVRLDKSIEGNKTGDKKSGDGVEQSASRQPIGKGAVSWNEAE